jgi:hypothetical protein
MKDPVKAYIDPGELKRFLGSAIILRENPYSDFYKSFYN